jgi:hypothetical protein
MTEAICRSRSSINAASMARACPQAAAATCRPDPRPPRPERSPSLLGKPFHPASRRPSRWVQKKPEILVICTHPVFREKETVPGPHYQNIELSLSICKNLLSTHTEDTRNRDSKRATTHHWRATPKPQTPQITTTTKHKQLLDTRNYSTMLVGSKRTGSLT